MSNTKTVMSQAANTQGIPLDITDVFSTYLYEGTSSAQTITNGIDLDGEGGMVWVKRRDTAVNHYIFDTERGVGNYIITNSTAAQNNLEGISAFNTDGFSVGTAISTGMNTSGGDYASWTFRKAPKFFDVVTYTGDGTNNRQIAHNLGSTPGMIIVKNTSRSSNWSTLHKDAGLMFLNDTGSAYSDADTGTQFGDGSNRVNPTSTHFTVASSPNVNQNNETHVAYVFAHNDGDGDFGDGSQDIIKCGSYTGNGSTTGPEIDLGFEPQWVMVKNATATGDWTMYDNMRGAVTGTTGSKYLHPNKSDAEATRGFSFLSNGFQPRNTGTDSNSNGQTYIYMAIRRGPLAVPTDATEVFETKTYSGTGAAQTLTTSLNGSDMALTANRSNSGALNPGAYDRLRGDEYLQTSNTSAAIASDSYGISVLSNKQNTVDVGNFASASGQTYVGQIFKRAPNFFDVVAYTGEGANTVINHNLDAIPEMVWVKNRGRSQNWNVYHKDLELNGDPASECRLFLHTYAAVSSGAVFWGTHTDTTFTMTVQNFQTNYPNDTYIAYLFASLDGISKVGSYTGNGSSQTIDCGFTSGARLVLIKSTSTTGDWYVWDTERGIVAGNDPHLSLNTTSAEVTSDDSIDPASSGFIVNQVAATNINVSSAEYIFYAIA